MSDGQKFTLAKYTTHFLHNLDMADEVVVAVRLWPQREDAKFQCVILDSYGDVTSDGEWFKALEDAQAWARTKVRSSSERQARNMLGDNPHEPFVYSMKEC